MACSEAQNSLAAARTHATRCDKASPVRPILPTAYTWLTARINKAPHIALALMPEARLICALHPKKAREVAMSIISSSAYRNAVPRPTASPDPIIAAPVATAAPDYRNVSKDAGPSASAQRRHAAENHELQRPCLTLAALDCVIDDTYSAQPEPGWALTRARTWTCMLCGPRILPLVLLDCWTGLTYPVRACAAGAMASRPTQPVAAQEIATSPAAMPEGLLHEIEQHSRG